jgi:type 1 fimbria pilin
LLISTPLWAANSTNTNVLTVKAELVTGSCDITASDVDLGDWTRANSLWRMGEFISNNEG